LKESCISQQKSPFWATVIALGTENPGGSPINDRISPFQVDAIHLDTFLRSFPSPWVNPTHSGISRYSNNAPIYGKLASAFVYEVMALSVLNSGVEQNLIPSNRRPKFGAVAGLLPKPVGAQSCQLTWGNSLQISSFSMGAPHKILNNSTNSGPN